MKVLVTGGGGFLGRAVVEQLLARGDTVRSLARGDYPDLSAAGVEVVRGDIGDLDTVHAACRNCDAVVHVAAKAGVWGPYREYHEPNVRGTHNVIAGCRAAGVRRLVHTSTPSVVFDGRDMAGVDESVPYPARHMNHYAATKAAAEQAVLAADGDDLHTLALRPHLIWGPGDTQLLPRFVAQRRAGKMRRLGSDAHLIDTTYIDDAARAHVLALDALEKNPNARGRAYFISQGEPIDVWEMINGMLGAAGLPAVDQTVPPVVGHAAGTVLEGLHKLFGIRGEPRMTRFVAHILTTAHWFDISAARRELGYEPSITIAEGLAQLKAWIEHEAPFG